MSKRPSLSGAFKKPGETEAPPAKPAPEKKKGNKIEIPKAAKGGSPYRQEVLNMVVGSDFKMRLGMLKLQTGNSYLDLTREALNLLFEKHGLDRIETED